MEWTTWQIAGTAVVLLVIYCWRKWSYWSSLGVPYEPACKVIFKNLLALMRRNKSLWKLIDERYYQHEGLNFVGTYNMLQPSIMVLEPGLVKTILIKEFDHFTDHMPINLSDKDEYMREMLSSASGSHWKKLRSIMSPTFTSGKMRSMFPLVAVKVEALMKHFTHVHHTAPHVSMKMPFSHYVIDVIASCAFGIDVNTLENEDEFSRQVAKLSEWNSLAIIKVIAITMLPKFVTSALGITITTPVMFFFRDVVMEAIKLRGGQTAERGDFLDLMLEQRAEQSSGQDNAPKYPLKDVTIIAQSLLFLLVGHQTTASMLTFTTFYLAKHPHLQQRLRQEVRSLLQEDGSLSYQAVMEAPFLDACVAEALRLHPPGILTERQCTKDYVFPGTNVVLRKGQIVFVPIWSLQHDPRYWSNPEEYCPDRFMPENKPNIVSGTYLPFGLGPRNCIGMRFALMESKLVLARTVLDFELTPAPGHEELQLSLMTMTPKDDVHLVFTPITEDQKGSPGSDHSGSRDGSRCSSDADPEEASSKIIRPTQRSSDQIRDHQTSLELIRPA